MKSLLNDKDEQSSRTDSPRYSLGQDIIYAVTKGRVRIPKSILLPSIFKTLTNNTELSIFDIALVTELVGHY